MNMADVIANKSTNVVSNKQSDVCDTKSNSVLIDFDTITPSSSQLISVSDDDDENKSILKNNVKKELIVHEKSLQELIENELALRICPNNECESQLMSSHDCDNRMEIDSEEPIRPTAMMSMESGGNCSLTNATFIEKEIEYCNASNELFTNQNQNGDNILIDKQPVEFIGANFDNIDDEDTPGQLSTLKSIDADEKIDKFLLMDVEELTANEENPVKNLTCNDPSNNYNVSEYEIDQHTTTNKHLISECHNSDSTDLVYLNLSDAHDNTVETIQVTDDVSEISNDTNNIGPLLSFHTEEVNPILVLTNNSLEPVENKQDIIANDNTITTHDKENIVYCQKNQQYVENNSTEIERIVENVDNTSRHLEDIMIDAAKPDMVIATIINETNNNPKTICSTNVREECMSCAIPVVQLPILDDVISNDISNAFHHEIHEEVITTSNTIISSTAKNSTKTKKKKINGIGDNVALPASTPRTKKTKKNKKNDLEKENISVNVNSEDTSMNTNNSVGDYLNSGELLTVDDLSNVNVKSLTQCYAMVSTRYGVQENYKKEAIETGVSIKLLKSSFNKFDALSKKSILNIRSVDTAKAQQQLNIAGQNGDTNPNCRRCDKVVFQMEQTKAEGLIWHKNCFRCVQCSKQLSVDNYQSHECTLYCKAHFKELFQPKPVDESNQPVSPRKPEMIIRENQPKELPPDVVRASDKPDLGLEELSSLNVKSRFQVFEKKSESETMSDIERSPSQISVKRSPSILSKLAKFQAKGMDIGVADESLNGIPYEESSESDEEEETEEFEDVDAEIIKSKRATRERPMSFSKMDDMKSRWEVTSQQGKRESQREARKEEIAGIRSRLFMGKQGKMKEMYQQAVATSERVMKINPVDEILCSTHARSIKERFERGEPIADDDDQNDNKVKQEKPDEDVIAAGISRKSRTLFLELDATAAKAGGPPVTPTNSKLSPDISRRARDAFMGRQVSNDVVRSTDTTEEVQVETSDISNKFKFFESYKEPEQQRRQFRITPPRDGQVKMNSPEREIYRDPDVIRADDRLDEIVHSDTTKKMLSIFRQMEENATKEDVPDGPKPLKRFTPPPEDKYAKATASDSDEDGEEDGNESSGGSDEEEEERNPNYVRASDKVEDEFLKQAQNAAKAKTLRAKFEQWETNDEKPVSHDNVAEIEMAQTISGENASIESAKSLRARFESLGSQSGEQPRTQKCKVNRFVENQIVTMDACETCQKIVYALEKVETNKKIFHKHCFRCSQCNCILRMDTFTLNNGKLYCIPHFKQLFIARGNYDEGFGVDPHKNKWSNNVNSSPIAEVMPIVIANGGISQMVNRD